MSEPATKYDVKFVNEFEEYNIPLEVQFTSENPEHVKLIISALASHYSGDPCRCFINGEEALLHLDWGLLEPEKESVDA